MSERTRRITRISMVAGWVVAIAGAGVLVTALLHQSLGPPWGDLNDWFLLVMIAGLAPLMLSFYELGGRTPLRLAQLAQVLGWASVITWCVLQKLVIFNVLAFEIDVPASGWFAVGSLALGYIGLWIAGANLLAGPWLPPIRFVGLAAGLAMALFATGLLIGGVDSGWTWLGGLGTMVVVPVWAVLMAGLLGRLSATEAPSAVA